MAQESEQLPVLTKWVEDHMVVAAVLATTLLPQLKEWVELKFINHIQLSQMALVVVQEPLQVHIIHHRFPQPEVMLKRTILRITTI